MHVGEVCAIHSTTHYDSCYNPIVQAVKYYVATLHRSTYSSPLSCFFWKEMGRKTDRHTTKLTAQHVTVIGDMVRHIVVKTHNLHLLISNMHFTEILTFNFLAWDLTWSSSLIESMNP